MRAAYPRCLRKVTQSVAGNLTLAVADGGVWGASGFDGWSCAET